jgi:hypothetical protein
MDERAKAEAVAEIAARHLDSLKRDLRQTIALRLLDENGAVSQEEIEEQFAAEWTAPDAQTLADVVAAKAAAAIEFHRREVEWETALVANAVLKADKVREKQQRLVEAADADAEAAQASPAVTEAEARLRYAEALAEYALARGNPSEAPPSRFRKANADPATGEGGA